LLIAWRHITIMNSNPNPNPESDNGNDMERQNVAPFSGVCPRSGGLCLQ